MIIRKFRFTFGNATSLTIIIKIDDAHSSTKGHGLDEAKRLTLFFFFSSSSLRLCLMQALVTDVSSGSALPAMM
jgi:hypothetical protein